VLVLGPAMLHRKSGGMTVSEQFIATSSRLLMWSIVPLAASLGIDLYLVSRVVLESRNAAAAVTALALGAMGLVWYVLPRASRARSRGRR
jgi:hypothetical protein